MKELKKIKILGKTYQYKLEFKSGEYRDDIITKFYDGVKIVKYRKYYFFGPVLKKARRNFFLKVKYNIESTSFTKKELREKLEKDFKDHIGLLNRIDEIKKGELI
jgi:hypothetical protein